MFIEHLMCNCIHVLHKCGDVRHTSPEILISKAIKRFVDKHIRGFPLFWWRSNLKLRYTSFNIIFLLQKTVYQRKWIRMTTFECRVDYAVISSQTFVVRSLRVSETVPDVAREEGVHVDVSLTYVVIHDVSPGNVRRVGNGSLKRLVCP